MLRIVLILSFALIAFSKPRFDSASLPAEFRTLEDVPKSKTYEWGYVISPFRGHTERKTEDGVVTGMVSFVNPNGDNVQWKYNAQPEIGFKVTEYKETPITGNPATDLQGQLGAIPNPLIKSAQNLGFISLEGTEPDINSARYSIDEAIVKSAGSESQLAYNLNAVPVAAVHDARAPPSKVTNYEGFQPVLINRDGNRDFQDSNDFVLLFPFEQQP